MPRAPWRRITATMRLEISFPSPSQRSIPASFKPKKSIPNPNWFTSASAGIIQRSAAGWRRTLWGWSTGRICNNNPLNLIDPWGLCGGFWSGFWRGATNTWNTVIIGDPYHNQMALESFKSQMITDISIASSVEAGVGFFSKFSINFWRYPNAGGGGIVVLLKETGKRVISFDWHQWGTTAKNFITKLHVDIPKVVQHWPWSKWGIKWAKSTIRKKKNS